MNKFARFLKFLILPVSAALAFLVYFYLLRPEYPTMTLILVEGVLFLSLTLLTFGALLILLITIFVRLVSTKAKPAPHHLRGQMIFLLTIVLILTAFVGISQLQAHTPAITGPDGGPLPNSIASLEQVRLGGVNQWLIIRGQDVNKPVLLFLSGGPGASEAGRVLRFNQELEKHFVVVIWEQRGCGKSYPSYYPKSKLTLDQYTRDLIELTELLRARFNQEKIYLVGHSWGTIPGIRAVQARPDLYYAYVGSAQMVNVRETDQMIYNLMLDHSIKTGDQAFVQTLKKQGPPPYTGRNAIVPYATLFGREYQAFEVPNIKSQDYLQNGDALLLMLKQPEYGWLDRIYYLLGMMNTFNVVYPQLQDLDFRGDAVRLEVPFYMLLGRHDMNNPSEIPQDYFDRLQAPLKTLYYFEDSGHGMIWEEPDLYHRIMIETVLPQTDQP